MDTKAREGDFIEDVNGAIFDVKGLIHPPNRVVAFIRYFPDEEGVRVKNGTAYGKVYSLSKRYSLLKERFPQYLVYDPVFDETLCEVPTGDVAKRYDPAEKLHELRGSRKLDALEGKAVQLATLVKENAAIPWRSIGISGSILTGLHALKSDIDIVVYGSENCRKAHSALASLLRDTHSFLRPYSREDLKALFDFRSKDTEMSFEDFVRTDSRKVLQGKFMDTDYFVRFVKDWDEVGEAYGDAQYRNVGYAKVKATVADDSEAIFTPCRYRIENVKHLQGTKRESIREIASFRGRFCEHAKTGEVVVAQGKAEKVSMKDGTEYCRLLIGNQPSDFMAVRG